VHARGHTASDAVAAAFRDIWVTGLRSSCAPGRRFGLILAVWATTGAMTAYMTAINLAYERKDARSFARKRLVALMMVAVIGVAFVLIAVL